MSDQKDADQKASDHKASDQKAATDAAKELDFPGDSFNTPVTNPPATNNPVPKPLFSAPSNTSITKPVPPNTPITKPVPPNVTPKPAVPSNPWPIVPDRNASPQNPQAPQTAKSKIAEANKAVRETVKEHVVDKMRATDVAEKLDYANKRLESDAIAKEHFWLNQSKEAMEEASREHLAERVGQAEINALNDKTIADAAAYNAAQQELPLEERYITRKTQDEMNAGKQHIER